jgi:sensor histidine kinase YesM
MLIQPYIENSIWHGIMHKDSGGKISIIFEKVDNMVYISIEDDGIGREKAKEYLSNKKFKSVGTKITESRLEVINSLYKTNMMLNYTDLYNDNNESCGTKVVLSIPIIQ